jgi:hypothetical protein
LNLFFFLATVVLPGCFSFNFLRKKRLVLAYGCLVKVFDAMEWGFVWEFVFWNFWENEEMVMFLSFSFCAVFDHPRSARALNLMCYL